MLNRCLPVLRQIGDRADRSPRWLAAATMASSDTSSAADVAWDLGDLFSSPDDPRITETIEGIKRDATEFATKYRGAINVPGGPTAETLLAALRDSEHLGEQMWQLNAYPSLLFAADTTNEAARDLDQKVDQHLTEVQNLTLFFDLEWLALEATDAERLIADPLLAPYSHYLRAARRFAPHTLSEAEEKVINEKDLTGRTAWQKLFTETVSGLTFEMEKDGETRKLNLSEILSLSHDPNREVRRRAHEGLGKGLIGQSQTITFIYDTLVQDHLTMDRLRHYDDPMQQRHLINQMPPAAVERMMDVTAANYPLAQKFFRLKAQLLDLPELMLYDQYAPLPSSTRTVTYDEARTMILDALTTFSPQVRDLVAVFFEENRIDAAPRTGKRGGAFCAPVGTKVKPYVLCNYTDNLRDAMTVAHELGHGMHFLLAGEQNLFNYYPVLPLAETASVFAEMVLFDHVLKRLDDPKEKLALIAGKIEEIFATVFRQNVLTAFEREIFKLRVERRLTPETIADTWIAANAAYYGDAVRMTDEYRVCWSYIPHFINTRFYCYSYVFGELLVLALYGLYREQGQAFVEPYLELLRSGGKAAPEELLAPLGVDVSDPHFWERGFAELRRLIDQVNDLVAVVHPATT